MPSARAPGSLMLMGEHAVLGGKTALATAVSCFATVDISWRQDKTILIHSNQFTPYELPLEALGQNYPPPYHFTLAVLNSFRPYLKKGLDLKIDTNFLPTLGLGSSAAVTAALLGALNLLTEQDLSISDLLEKGRTLIRQVQGRGSGTDLATSLFGGVIAYRQEDNYPLVLAPPKIELHAIYSGYKTPTPVVLQALAERYKADPLLLSKQYEAIEESTQQGLLSWQSGNWQALGQAFNQQFKDQQILGISDPILDSIMDVLLSEKGCLGAKISGSGWGDCAIALGSISPTSFPAKDLPQTQIIPVSWEPTGLVVER